MPTRNASPAPQPPAGRPAPARSTPAACGGAPTVAAVGQRQRAVQRLGGIDRLELDRRGRGRRRSPSPASGPFRTPGRAAPAPRAPPASPRAATPRPRRRRPGSPRRAPPVRRSIACVRLPIAASAPTPRNRQTSSSRSPRNRAVELAPRDPPGERPVAHQAAIRDDPAVGQRRRPGRSARRARRRG